MLLTLSLGGVILLASLKGDAVETHLMSMEYVAGIMDGEGCIGAYRIPTGVRVRCSVANTHEGLVQCFGNQFGGRVRLRKYNEKNPKWKQLWMWEIDFRNAEEFLLKVSKFLFVKKEQAAVALEILSLIPRRSPIGTRQEKYHRRTADERLLEAQKYAQREALIDRLHRLNQRGVDLNV